MDRRSAIKRLSAILGGTLSAPALAGVLGGCEPPASGEDYVLQTFSPEQNEFVTRLAELIIPETDTPGATGARVNEFIDLMLAEWYPEEDRAAFLDGLTQLNASFEEAHGQSFLSASSDEQFLFMESLDEDNDFFSVVKELTVVGYYTSEIGASQELRHQMIFGEYDGDVEFGPEDRAWS